jgi:hypothetical protein
MALWAHVARAAFLAHHGSFAAFGAQVADLHRLKDSF